MITKICFVRHGRTNANEQMVIQGRIDNPLNDNGILDAHQIATIIKQNNLIFDIAICSPLKRAQKTANIILHDLNQNIEIITNDLFIEREFGEAEGLSITPENYKLILDDYFSGMETKSELCARSKKALEYLLSNYSGKNIIVVAHSHFIKSLFMQYLPDVKFNTTFGHLGLSYLIFDGKKNIAAVFNTKKVNF